LSGSSEGEWREDVVMSSSADTVSIDRDEQVRRTTTRRSRSRKSSETPKVLPYATLALLAWLPFPIGGHADWAAALAATLTGVLLLAWLIVAWRRSLTLAVPFVLLPAGLLVAGVAGWSVLQVTPGVLPVTWNHPIWEEVAAYGLAVEGVVSLNRSASFDALMRLLAACGMFLLAFALAQRETQARQLLTALLAITTGYALFGIVQEFTGLRLSGSTAYRGNVVSTFVNRNHFATYANLGLVIALGLMIEPLLRGDSSRKEPLGRRIAQAIATVFEERRYPLMAAVILLLAVIGSASRGGLLSLIGAALFLLLLVFLVSRATRGAKLLVTAVVFGGGGLIVWLTGDVLLDRFQVIFAADTLGDVDPRIQAWEMTLAAIAERPLLGYGHGAYQELFFLAHGPELGVAGVYDHAHNDYLQAAAELGLPAAGALWLALLLVWGSCLVGALKRRRRRVYPLVASTVGVLVGLHAIVDFSLLMPAVAMTLAAILGIGCAQSRASQGSRGRAPEHNLP
jgi:O-antigen ligase